MTCLFLVDTRFSGDPVGCGHQDPQSATCPLLPGCLGVWCWVGGAGSERERRPSVGSWWDAADRVRSAPAWQETGKPLCSSGVSGWPSQRGLGKEALV